MTYSWINQLLFDNKNKNKYGTPIQIADDASFHLEISRLFTRLEKDLSDANAPMDYKEIFHEYKSQIFLCINAYYEGDLAVAQKAIYKLIKSFKKDGVAISKISKSISFNNPNILFEDKNISVENIEFYRARVSQGNEKYVAKEMLHVPFDQRGKVGNERFSISGLPCLYLGSTTYCCWIEMRRPTDENFNVAAIRLIEDFEILNLTINSVTLPFFFKEFEKRKNDSKTDNYAKTLFKLWILTLVTSFTVLEKNRTFKSEYIIPQMIMLGCRKADIDGVAYLSKQVNDDVFSSRIAINLALFATYKGERQHSKICESVYVSRPFNYSIYKNMTNASGFIPHHLHLENDEVLEKDLDHAQMHYSDTQFFNFDKFLFSNLKLEKIDINQ